MTLSIDVKTLQELLQKKAVVLIDVREQSEYNESKIEGSLLMPLGELDANKVQELMLQNPDKTLVMQCRSGMRSAKACYLIESANPNLKPHNLEGGIMAWKAMQNS